MLHRRRCTLPDPTQDPAHVSLRHPEHERGRSSDRFGHLPQGSFRGRIHIVDTEAKALRASLVLRRARTVGLDTESRPSFRRGEVFPISLVQIATSTHAFLYRVRPGAPFRSLQRLIENPSVRKIVQGATEESRELLRDLGIRAQGFVDLPTTARAAGYTELNLRALAANALGIRISKSAQRSDWSRSDLTQAQIEYAATDAWACLAIYERLSSGSAPRAPEGPTAIAATAAVVRPATHGDAGAIAELVRELAAGAGERSPVDAAVAHVYLDAPGCSVLVAERAGRLIGMLSLSVRLNLFHGRDCCLIEELVVSSPERRGGVGRSLLHAAIREAERRRCAEISVSTSAGNRGALALYRSAGLTDESVLLEKHFDLRAPRRRRGRRGRSGHQ